jgi:hypothetical protein
VIAKMQGSVARGKPEEDSFVITENHYIDYLNHADINTLIPVNIASRMRLSHFLFLGYSLKNWNLRVTLRRLWGNDWSGANSRANSWAILPSADDKDAMEERSWLRRGVEPLSARLEEYVDQLSAALISASTTTAEPS